MPAHAPRARAPLALTIGVGLLVFFAVTAVVVLGWSARQRASEHAADVDRFLERKATQFSMALADAVDTRLRLITAQAALVTLARAQREPDALRSAFDRLQQAWPELAWIGVSDAGGRVLVATGAMLEGADVGARDWFAGGALGPHVGAPHEPRLLARYPQFQGSEPVRLIDLSAPIVDADGRVVGVLAAHLHLRWLDQVRDLIGATQPVAMPYRLALYDRSGQPVLRRPGDNPAALALPPLDAGAAARMLADTADGSRIVAVSAVGERGPAAALQWVATAEAHPATRQADTDALLTRALAAGGTLAVLAALAAGAMALRISQPLRDLAASVRQARAEHRTDPALIPLAGPREALVLGREIRQLFTDLNERGQALRDSEARLQALVESAPDSIIAVDEQHRVRLFNAAAERAFGIARDAMLGERLDRLLPDALRAGHDERLDRFARATSSVLPVHGGADRMARRADGTLFPIEASLFRTTVDGATWLTAILRDVSERRAAEAALRDSEARYRALFETHPVPMWIHDDDTLRLLEVNRAMQSTYAYSREQLLALRTTDLQAAAGDAECAGPARHRAGDGRVLRVDLSGHALQWGGRAAHLVVAYDVTERLAAQTALADSSRRLSLLSRQLMDKEAHERTQLARTLHDQFAQNLAAARLALEAAAQRVRQARELEQARSGALAGVQSALALLGEAVVDVRTLLNELRPPLLTQSGLRAALRYEVDRRAADAIEVVLAPAGHGPEARYDATVEYALFAIAREALHNALLHAHAARIDIVLTLAPMRAQVEVRDDGIGFDPDEKLRRSGRLGLTGMQERAQWIGARLELDARPGAGSTVRIVWDATVLAPLTEVLA